jgi:serine protease Do
MSPVDQQWADRFALGSSTVRDLIRARRVPCRTDARTLSGGSQVAASEGRGSNHRYNVLGGSVLVAATFLLALPLLGVAPGRPGNPRAETVQKVFPSAVRVQLRAGGELVRSASGIAFAREGHKTFVLTNAHFVEPSRSWASPVCIEVLPSAGGQRLVATVVAEGKVPDADMAILEVAAALPVTPLAQEDALELGDDLVVIGAPFGKGLSVAAGIVSQVEYDFAENAAEPRRAKSLKTDAAIGYGSSGGGVFDVPRGRLIGLVEGYRTARVAFGKDAEQYAFDVPMPGETFVAPAAKIRWFLQDKGLARLAPGEAGVATRAQGAVVPAAAAPAR